MTRGMRLLRPMALVALLSVLLLTACGGGKTQSQTPAGGTAPSPAPSAAPTPKSGGTLNATFSSDPGHLDPHRGVTAQNFVPLVYNTLVRFKTGTGVKVQDFIIEPDLAETWEQPNPTTYVFHLRKGVKWQTIPPVSGREFTSDDVLFSFDRMLANDAENIKRDLFAAIDKVEAPDKYTVRITLKQPFAPFLSNLATVFASILPRADVDFKKVTIGTGPFMLTSSEKGVKYVYKKNSDYFEKGLPYLDQINILIIPDMAARLSAFRAGQLDVVDLLAYQQAKPLLDANSKLSSEQWPGNFSVMARLNVTKPPLDNPKVRQALSLALDRDAIARALGGGQGVVNGPVPTALGDSVVPPDQLFGFKRDVAKAKQLLADAGLAGGFSLDAVGGNSPDNRKIMLEAMAGQWAEVGVKLNIKLVAPTEINKLRVDKNFQVMADNFTLASDPDNYLYIEYHSKSSGNIGGYNDPALDKLLEQQRTATDPAQRKQLVADAQKKVAEDAFILTTGDPIYVSLSQPSVKGFRHSYINQYLPLKNIWLDK